MHALLGVDVGTSACKVVAVDERGAVLAGGSQTYATRYPRPGWAEQDPEAWYQAACGAIRACMEAGALRPEDVAGLSIAGPAHNVALMDKAGEVLYPTIHWSDLRSAPQAKRLEAAHGEAIFDITYQRPNPSWTLAQLAWLKENEPEVWARLRRILVTKDYVRTRLTGGYQTDVYDATGTQLYDVEAGRWSRRLCELLGFPAEQLPEVLPAGAIAGEVQPHAAHDTGLLPGTPAAVGSGDSVVEAFGVGAVEAGQCIVKLGTAANVNLVTASPRPSPQSITYCHVVPAHFFTITATNSGTATMTWFCDAFIQQRNRQAYEHITELAAQTPPGSEGLLFHPYLMGERSPHWDPHLRGDFVGIGARHGRAHFARAMLEGVAFSVRDCYEAVERLGQPLTERRLLGGGARSALWRQIVCDVLGQPLLKPAVEGASFGAALLAGVAVGVFADWAEAVSTCVETEEILYPDPATHALYNDYFAVYREVTRDLAAHSHRLAALAAQPAEE